MTLIVVGKRSKTVTIEQLDSWWRRLFELGVGAQVDPWPTDAIQEIHDEMYEGLDVMDYVKEKVRQMYPQYRSSR